MRYYLHGDLIEGGADLYYCRCCDGIFKYGHFQEHDKPDPSYPTAKHSRNHTRYRKEVEKWVSWRWKGVADANHFSRPLDPPNLFAAICRKKWKTLKKFRGLFRRCRRCRIRGTLYLFGFWLTTVLQRLSI
jgi:hypothetical protein